MSSLIVLETPGVYGLKPQFQSLLRPLVGWLAALGVRANQVTVFSCAISIALGVLLLTSQNPHLFLLLPPVLLIRMVLNAADGMLAREFGQETRLGVYLNELTDVVSDTFLYLPFAHLRGFSPFWVWNVVVLAVISEMAGTVAVMTGVSRRYDGPLGKSDRALIFGAMGLWAGLAGGLPAPVASLLPKIAFILLAVTVVNRVRNGLKEAGSSATDHTADLVPEMNMRRCEERTFEAIDGTSIFYRHWPRVAGAGDRAVLLLHRGHEHSGRLQHLVDELNLPEYAMFAWDARGHGVSPGRRGYAPSVGTLVKDLDTFVRDVIVPQGIAVENLAVVGQSVGSVLAAAWVHDYAPKIRCMVLAAPAFKIKLYVPFARPALRVLYQVFGDFAVQSYVKADFLTHDRDRIAEFRSDPLITRSISVKVLIDLYDTAARVIKDSPAIQTPTQLLISGSDYVVDKKPQLEFFNRLGSAVREVHELKGFYHDTLGEKDRYVAINKAREFILKEYSRPCKQPSLLDADRKGATHEEYERLRRPLRAVSVNAIAFGLVKAGLKTGGRLSNGIRLGLKTGFDSGATLDYVYRNRASGTTPLGKLIDWFYINSIGWRGIRVRKQHLEQFLAQTIADLQANATPVRIVDIAAGHGRYVLDAVKGHTTGIDRILLRDFSDDNVERGAALIAERNLGNIARFEQGDAFDRASLAAIVPRPTVGVVSGLYELFPDNESLGESLRGLADALRPRGYLIYTGQPWHPQLEFIARTLSSHRGHKSWVMRRRTQAELDQLVEAAGFQKIDQLTDDWGIFTVSLARRVAA
jgi:alpha-beta hydrolase superfamily lysophospholipase/phosphatidylglycerophosphate synthase/SAM-dependent methyltransferase